jgi:hypothetical protein
VRVLVVQRRFLTGPLTEVNEVDAVVVLRLRDSAADPMATRGSWYPVNRVVCAHRSCRGERATSEGGVEMIASKAKLSLCAKRRKIEYEEVVSLINGPRQGPLP